ncbi:MAG: macA [Gammaproteobacteria bacterium]|jgi:multidrug efflux pump subunit AcrA (membrane-fusion protein)|nr:macA [Gammaproteobacteria bacterium]
MYKSVTKFLLLRQASIKALALLSTSLLLCSCGKSNTSNIFTVTPQKISHTLAFKSTITPAQIINVQSPAEGTIQQVSFSPGSFVEKDKPLVTLYSPKFIADYQNAMLSYLKAKDDYSNGETTFIGTEDLWKHGLISRGEYISQKSSLANSYAMLVEQQNALQKFLPPNTPLDQSLSLENKAAINKLFDNQSNLVNVYAPTNGIALSPVKSDSSNNPNSNTATLKLSPGTIVHQGDSLLTIGDLSGFNLIVSVSEMDINRIKLNMPATITSDAFPETLNGTVQEISIEAKASQSDVTLPEFPVRIFVPNVPKADLKDIRLGMTAKVNVEIGSSQQILVPLDAVGSLNGQNVVKKISGHQSKIVPVTTGDTTLNQVTILSGLNPGDQILVPYQA